MRGQALHIHLTAQIGGREQTSDASDWPGWKSLDSSGSHTRLQLASDRSVLVILAGDAR